MILEELKQHLKEIQSVLDILEKCHSDETEHFIDSTYHKKLNLFVEKFQYWKPEIFIHVEGGIIQAIWANTNIFVNLWDDENQKCEDEYNIGISYNDRKLEWEQMIKSNLNSKEIKLIY